jgi:hypothetical protein
MSNFTLVIFVVDLYGIFITTHLSDKCKFVLNLGFCIQNIYCSNIQNMYNLQQSLARLFFFSYSGDLSFNYRTGFRVNLIRVSWSFLICLRKFQDNIKMKVFFLSLPS